MTTHELIKSYYDAFNREDWDGMLALLSEDVIHDGNQSRRTRGKDAFRGFLAEMAIHYREQLSDFVIFANADGSRAAAEFICQGTYLKTQVGLPVATQQTYQLPVGAFFEVQGNLITRITNYYNLPDWIAQVKGP
jgi:steroid delta-isomerase-like uncharacterized protein